MTESTGRAAQRRDQAFRDLIEVDRQLADGELSAQDAARLRSRYEREAAAAIGALRRVPSGAEVEAAPAPAAEPRDRPRRLSPRYALYGLGIVILLLAALTLPGSVLNRPPGGLVTGNEAVQAGPGSSLAPAPAPSTSPRNLDTVSDAELEAVIAANPEIVGMRLALAQRYVDKDRYDLAVVHYTKVLALDPANAEAKGHLGWIMLQLDRPAEAARLVDEARTAGPELLDVMWFQANIRLYGLNDPRGALATLDIMQQRPDLTPVVRQQVAELRRVAAQRLAGPR